MTILYVALAITAMFEQLRLLRTVLRQRPWPVVRISEGASRIHMEWALLSQTASALGGVASEPLAAVRPADATDAGTP